jgi:hypothetical protein
MRRQTPVMDHKATELLAIQALTFLVEDSARCARFLDLTGIDAQEIRSLAQEKSFLTAVLDHLGGDERLLSEFAAQAGLNPADVDRARKALGGPDWERDSA